MEDGKKELPVVIPLLVYHGKGNWNYEKDIREMIPDFHILPEYLKQMLPVLRHDFINIRKYNEEDIIQKIQELGGKGEKIMTILQEREQKGIQQGIQQGMKQGMIEMVENLIREGIDIDTIIKTSKLSREEIEEIKKAMLN